MTALAFKRIIDGVSVSGVFGESLTIVEKFIARVDDPRTSKSEIMALFGGGGVYWGAPHWEFPALRALEFDLSTYTKDGMLWLLTLKYTMTKRPPKANGIPEDTWEAVGGVTTVPVFTSVGGATICNAAGDPLEGLERERSERGWMLTKNYEAATNPTLWETHRNLYAGRVNSGTWSGGAAKTWKCDFKGASTKIISKFEGSDTGDQIAYIETKWEFRYEPETWKCMPWDVGFMQLVSGQKKVILGADGKAVKQPVALNPDGTKRADGQPPLIINNGSGVDIYESANWTTDLGNPDMTPSFLDPPPGSGEPSGGRWGDGLPPAGIPI